MVSEEEFIRQIRLLPTLEQEDPRSSGLIFIDSIEKKSELVPGRPIAMLYFIY